MQRMKAPAVQLLRPAGKSGIVRGPGCDGIGPIDARGGEDRLRELAYGDVVLVAGKNPLRPGEGRIGHDVPIDVEASDLVQSGPIGDGVGLVGARRLGGVLGSEQHRILANDGEPRTIRAESLGDALIKPARRAIEACVGRVSEPGERDLLVGEDRRDEARARLVSLDGDPAR